MIRINSKSALWLSIAGVGSYFAFKLFEFVATLSAIVN